MKYRLSPLAEQDLDAIWLHLAEASSEETADHVVATITDRFAALARHPKLGKQRPELSPDVRSIPVERYLIYYREGGPSVMIARVLHASRDQLAAWHT